MTYITIILLSFILSAFFSGMEIAFLSANKLWIEIDNKQGTFPSQIISFFSKNPAQYIATMLVGNNIALVLYGSVMELLLEPVISSFISSHAGIIIIQTIIATLIILIPADFLPKVVFRNNPNFILSAFAVPVLFFYILLFPVARLSIIIADFFLRIFLKQNITDKEQKVVFGKVDLDFFISQAQNDNSSEQEIQHEIRIFQNALDFSEVKVRECRVPRTEIVAVDVNDTISELNDRFIITGLSRIIIYRENIDNVIGYVRSSELFKSPATIAEAITEIPVVPESMPADMLLEQFLKQRKNIAVVVDEFGGTSGIVTTEDVIEEIFGEIEDEHDKIILEERQLPDDEFIFSGRLEIDYLNEKYRLGIEESEEYNTLAGYILFHHQSMPEKNESFTVMNYFVTVLKVTSTRIELLKLRKVRDE